MAEFRTILVANRGEIACRVMRTAKAMGYRTAAVYSEADDGALHVRMADTAACIGPAEARLSYLDAAAIIDAAKRLGADAVHPGYGFLSENAGFADACAAAGLVFIGPPAAAIAAMGNKAEAKRRMQRAGVPVLPGYQGADQSDDAFAREAARIGFPLMVKAADGGGGRGMRLVSDAAELVPALALARVEARNAFGSAELILERALIGARHIEIQIVADAHGHVVHLGERDCSVQRRHQKVLEETPSPAVGPELRARMGAAAAAAAGAIGYCNVGTVEFLLAGDGAFYFLEMNTRLQVEHPVTEMVTGLDLVELQIRIAAGEPLPFGQDGVRFNGHAIEARLYAEAPHEGFLPQSGRLALWRPPVASGVRVDHALIEGQTIGAHYDPLLAKIIAHGPTREEARRRLVDALEDTVALGPVTNRSFLIDCLKHPAFADGAATTDFVPSHFARVAPLETDSAALALAAVLWFEASARRHGHDPARAWASSGGIAWPLRLETGGGVASLTVTPLGGRRYHAHGSGTPREIALAEEDGRLRVIVDGKPHEAANAFAEGRLLLKFHGADVAVRETLYDPPAAVSDAAPAAELRSPMNGRVVAVLAVEGDKVEKGQRLAVVEAMKMQHELTAGAAGTVARVSVTVGDQVEARQLLVELELAG